MKKTVLITILMLSFVFANELPSWFIKNSTDINALVKKANRVGKTAMLFFDEDGCPWCKKMIKENFKKGKLVKTLKEKFLIMHIDNFGERKVIYKDKNITEEEFRKSLGIYFSPTMAFLDSSGKIVALFPGYRNPKKFKTILEYILSKAYKKYSYSDYLSEREFK